MYVKVTASRDPVTVPSVAKIAWGNNSEDRPVITDTNSSVLWVAIRNNIGQYVDGQLSGGYLAEGAADASITPMDTNSQLVEGEYNIAPNTSAIFRIAGKIRELPYDKYAVQFTYDMLLQLIVGKSRNQPVRIWLRDRPNFVSKPVPAPGFKED